MARSSRASSSSSRQRATSRHLTKARQARYTPVIGIVWLAASADATDEIINIGSGTETSLTHLAHALLRVMGSKVPLEFGPPRGVNAVTRRLADVSLAAERLGWKAEVGLDEGLRRLVAWWRAQREAEGHL